MEKGELLFVYPQRNRSLFLVGSIFLIGGGLQRAEQKEVNKMAKQ